MSRSSGIPSAGKSSLVAAMSSAKPKIADYPFTTLHPNLGVVESRRDPLHRSPTFPGLIEGASEGKGLGLEFLRHVERCSALLHVLDCGTLDPGRDPISDLDVILGELAAYPVPEGQTPLLERPQLIALNKIDVPDARELADFVRPALEERGYRVFEISAVSREGLRELSFALAELVEADRAVKAAIPVQQRHRHPSARRQRARLRRSRSRAAPSRCTASSEPSPSAGCSRPTSPTTRPSASSPIVWPSWASKTACSRRAPCPARP